MALFGNAEGFSLRRNFPLLDERSDGKDNLINSAAHQTQNLQTDEIGTSITGRREGCALIPSLSSPPNAVFDRDFRLFLVLFSVDQWERRFQLSH